MQTKKVAAIVLAAGSGSRMGTSTKKQYLTIAGKEIIAYTLDVFEQMPEIEEIILVVGEAEKEEVATNICKKYGYTKIKEIVVGGKERQDSVWNGLVCVSEEIAYVAVHDGARPFVSEDAIRRCILQTYKSGASILAVPVKDTIKIVNAKTKVVEDTPSRDCLWAVQTPQVFEKDLLKEAHYYGKEQAIAVTDDSMLVEHMGKEVTITEGEYTNIKITTPEDLVIGEKFINK